jgi:hypothetical protein
MDGAERICPGSTNLRTMCDLESDEIVWRSVGLSVKVANCAEEAAQALDQFVASCEDEFATDVQQSAQALSLTLSRLRSVPTTSRDDFLEKRRIEKRVCACLDPKDEILLEFRQGISKDREDLLDQLIPEPLTMLA